MSGYKRSPVTIDEKNYRHLHDAEMQRIFKAINNLETQSSQSNLSTAVQAQLDQLEDRQEKFTRLAEYLQDQTYQVEMELEQDLNAGRTEFYEQLSGIYDQIWGNFAASATKIKSLAIH